VKGPVTGLFCFKMNPKPEVMKNSNKQEARAERRTLLQIIRQRHPLRLMLVFAVIIIGCQTYYRAVPAEPTTGKMTSYADQQKYVVLHTGQGVFHLSSVIVDYDKQQISGVAEPLSEDHQYYLKTKPDGKPTPFTKSNGDPRVEIHVFADSCQVRPDEENVIPLAEISRVEEYIFDAKATKQSRVIGALSITAGVLILGGAAIASGLEEFYCPEVYVANGNEYHIAGEIYAGAMSASMERDDYLQLTSLQPVNGTYAIRIAGKGSESDQTNLAELAIVEHSPQTTVAFDLNGQAHSIADAQSPIEANNRDDQDVLPLVAREDSAYAFFDDVGKSDKSMSTIDMRFARPKDQQEGKLVIRGSSTEWQGYVYEKFIEQFGTAYHAYAEAQAKKPATEHYAWLQAQGLSLSVYIETPKGWVLQGAIPPTGAWVDRDIVVTIDLADVPGDAVNVRLSCAFMAWQVDQVAMDFSPDEKMRIITIPPFTATDEKGQDVTHLLTATDDRYLVQADSGSVVTVTYLAPPLRQDRAYTAFLHGRGYYTLTRDYTHAPNPGFTKTFERDGQFAKFSRERYADLIEQYSQTTGQDAGVK
jgi:hypothetical protein